MRVALLALLTALCAFSQRLEFQVASIKPSPGTDQRGFYTDVRGGRLSVRNMTLFNLIQTAYRINDLQLPDVPGWITSARYDIDAQPSASFVATQDQLYDMLQSLLEHRFQFKFHKVTREQSGYALTVDDRGPKLAPAGEGSPARSAWAMSKLPTSTCRCCYPC